MTTFEVPAIVEDALLAATRRRLPPELCGGPALTAAVVDRSRRYTSERERLGTPGGGRASIADLAARALFFTVADAAKVHVPLAELAGRALPAPAGFLSSPTLGVLDAGAGCGAMTLGLCTFLAARAARSPGPPPVVPRVHATLVDRDGDALRIAADAIAVVARALALDVTLVTITADVGDPLPAGPFDLILAGSVLNELAVPADLARALVAVLAPSGVAIVVEPALRETTRALHQVRDALVAAGTAAVLAPCTRRDAPCPALADERDWCHDHRPLALPPRARQVARVTGLRDGDMKLAYLVLCRPEAAPPPVATWRVVSDPHPSKGKLELILCGSPGWVPARLLKRHRSVDNRALERARRGDVLTLEPPPTPNAPDVTNVTRVSHHTLPG